MRALLAGDTHGNYQHIQYLFDVAKDEQVDLIFVLGDFGYWPHAEQGRLFLEQVADLVDTLAIPLWWLDGNHECHDLLQELPLNEAGLRPVLSDREWKSEFTLHPFAHVPRGLIWTFDLVRFCAFGGAASIDKEWRLKVEAKKRAPRTLWWPQEDITEADLVRFEATRPEPVDVFLSHDVPLGVDVPFIGPKGDHPPSEANRRRLEIAVNMVRPELLIHGHHHKRYRGEYRGTSFVTKVIGLDCDDKGKRSWLVLDIQDGVVHIEDPLR